MERKILGRVFGPEAEQFAAHGGKTALQEAVRSFGEEHPFTCLVPNLEGGADPDDAFSKIPYEKGFYFLYHLQVRALMVAGLDWQSCVLRGRPARRQAYDVKYIGPLACGACRRLPPAICRRQSAAMQR